MECREAQQLIPLLQAGELEAAESARVRAHLDGCAECRTELAMWSSLSSVMQEMASEVKAPPGFAGKVTAQINQERHSWYDRIPRAWKQTVAAAAALALIAAGSLQMGLGQLLTRVGPQVAENPPGNEIVEPGPDVRHPGIIDPETQSPSDPVGEEPGENEPVTPPEGSGQSSRTPTETEPPVSVSEQVAFLNLDQTRVIQSTMLGIHVNSLGEAREQVAAAGSQANGTFETLSVYNTAEGRQETVKMTVAADAAPAVIEKISTLGEVVTRDDTSRDISEEFRSRGEQFLDLISQKENIADEADLAELNQTLAGLEKQLRSWMAETEQYTIVVQLQVR